MEDAADMSLRRLCEAPKGLRRTLQTRRDRLQSGSRSERRALRAAEAGRDARAAGDADIEAGAPEANPNLDLRTRLLLLAAREKKDAANNGGAAGGGAGGACCALNPNPNPNPNPNTNPNPNP